MSVHNALQTALYGVLDTALTESVYSQANVPDNTDDRYVVIGNTTAIEWDTDGSTGFECTATIHAWDTSSDNRSFVPINTVMGNIYDTLHRADYAVVGYNMIGTDVESMEPMMDPDGVTKHGVVTVRIILRSTA